MNAIITISVFNFLGIFGNSSNYHISGFSTKLEALSSNVKPVIQPKINIPELDFNMTRARGQSKSCDTYFLGFWFAESLWQILDRTFSSSIPLSFVPFSLLFALYLKVFCHGSNWLNFAQLALICPNLPKLAQTWLGSVWHCNALEPV